MTGRVSRHMSAIYSGVSVFLVVFLTLLTYFYSRNPKTWGKEMLEAKMFGIPFVVSLLVISVFVGLWNYLLSSLVHRSQYGKIETKLQLLVQGNYDSPALSSPIPYHHSDAYIGEVDRSIVSISKKMQKISKELQQAAAKPEVIDGVTRESILVQERHRLARELHDSVSQQLFAAMMMLSAMNEIASEIDLPESFKKQLGMVAEIINASQSEMRALLLHLRPVSLEGKSLRQGIEQLLRELMSKVKIDIRWEVEDVKLAPAIEDHLFRIVQELLSNTLRHSKAKHLEVYLHQVGQNILLRVIDDGVGFDWDPAQSKAGSYGLNNINERVNSMGGTLKIISFPNQGTSIEIKVPAAREEKNDQSIISG